MRLTFDLACREAPPSQGWDSIAAEPEQTEDNRGQEPTAVSTEPAAHNVW